MLAGGKEELPDIVLGFRVPGFGCRQNLQFLRRHADGDSGAMSSSAIMARLPWASIRATSPPETRRQSVLLLLSVTTGAAFSEMGVMA